MADCGAPRSATDVPVKWLRKLSPFPTVVPPFARQGMTVKDMYDGFMNRKKKAGGKTDSPALERASTATLFKSIPSTFPV